MQDAEGHALRGAFEGGENGRRDADIAGDLLQSLACGMPQTAQLAADALWRVALARMRVPRRLFRLQRLADGGRIEPTLRAIPGDALQPCDIVGAVLAMPGFRASRHHEALRFP